MLYEIIHKPIKHGYLKFLEDGTLRISIPDTQKGSRSFYNQIMKKAQTMRDRQMIMRTVSSKNVYIRGEAVAKTELVDDWKKRLSKELLIYCKRHILSCAEKLGKQVKDIQVKKVSSKRGHCTHDQVIMINSSLIHLPQKCAKYVAIHEACHLKIKNHGPRFRALVEEFMPNYEEVKKELNRYKLIEKDY